MRVAIVGLGIQGRKRLAVAGADVVATVDPVAPEARFKAVEQVPLDAFDAALVCIPDQAKVDVMTYLLSHGKHVLVEKPLLADEGSLHRLAELARDRRAACYTAYNHRFEPHLVRLKQVVEGGGLGPLHLARLFYGNGTARDVRASAWRDQGMGVLGDLGSHLLDLVLFLFGRPELRFEPWSLNRFENRAFDHVLLGSTGRPVLMLEASLLAWRNTFSVDVIGERGSAHVQGLCKWGPSTFIRRTRVLPSGTPGEEAVTLPGPQDPTWALEYAHFKQLCGTGGTNLEHDAWINRALNDVMHGAAEAVVG
jgi:predicted dehydrogenase